MHPASENQQPSRSRRRVLLMGVVAVALMLAVVGVAVQDSVVSQQLQLFRTNTASNLRASSDSTASAADHAAGSIDAVASSSNNVQAEDQSGSRAHANESVQDQQSLQSSSEQDSSGESPATATGSRAQANESDQNQQSLQSASEQDSSGESPTTTITTIATTTAAAATANSYRDAQSGSKSGVTAASSLYDDTNLTTTESHEAHEAASIAASDAATSMDSTLLEEILPPSAHLMVSGFEMLARDPALPPAVHALWIGDINRVVNGLERYRVAGFELTIHNDVDNILEGFAPHVHRAYQLAIPRVAGFDFLKLLLLYKYGGLVVDADTYPSVLPSQVQYSSDCHVLFGKETHLGPDQFSHPTYRQSGGNTYGYSRPYQLLNWAMLAREPRNTHVAALIDGAMQHFYGLRDVDESLVQDIAGSGLMSDYVALLYAENDLDYVSAFNTPTPPMDLQAVDGFCMLERELRDGWIQHEFTGTWKGAGE